MSTGESAAPYQQSPPRGVRGLSVLKRRLEMSLGRSLFGLACRALPELRAAGDLLHPSVAREVDWRSGLRDSVHILHGAVRSLKPRVVVEIGSARGLSTCALGAACLENGFGKVYAIDPNTSNDWSEIGTSGDNFAFLQARIREYGLESHVELMRMPSDEAARGWSLPIDFLFIDGDHSYEGVKRDFDIFRPWLTPNALVAFHDSTWEYIRDNPYYRESMGVPRYLEELQKCGFESVTFPIPPGLTLVQGVAGGFPFVPGRTSGA